MKQEKINPRDFYKKPEENRNTKRFTGYKDRYGNDLYEGDRVRLEDPYYSSTKDTAIIKYDVNNGIFFADRGMAENVSMGLASKISVKLDGKEQPKSI